MRRPSVNQRLKRLYRREPLSSFVLLSGTVAGMVGSSGGQWVLFGAGVGLALGSLGWRWLRLQDRPLRSAPPRRFLPPAAQPPLPVLNHERPSRP